MKKSEIYQLAMEAVLETDYRNAIKVEILAVLNKEKELALWMEEIKAKEVDLNEDIRD